MSDHFVTAGDIDTFTKGLCGVFARAMTELTGWPIYQFAYGVHWFVMAPDNRPVDIEGVHDLGRFQAKWGGHPLRPIDPGSCYANGIDDEPEAPRARMLAPVVLEQVKARLEEEGKALLLAPSLSIIADARIASPISY